MGKHFKNDDDSYESNDGIDHHMNDNDDVGDDIDERENDDWYQKKNFYGLDDMPNDEIDF